MPRLSAKDKSLVYSNLEKYARSGLGMERACDSLLSQPRLPRAEREFYEGFLEGIRRGRNLGEALGSASASVSPLEREVVLAAEAGGKLEQAFAHLGEYFRRLDRTRRRVLKGLAYPFLLIHVAIPVSTLATAVFRGFDFAGSSPAAPDSAGRYLAALSETGWKLLTLWSLLLLGGVAAAILARLGRRSAPVDALLRRIPFLGRARRAIALERFAQVFEIFLLSGRRMSESLEGAARAAGSGLIEAAGRRGAVVAASGDSLAAALRAGGAAFPGDFVRGMAAAEEAGQLDRELDGWGRFYAESAAEAMDRLGEWTPKLFYWGVLLYVSWLIVQSALAYRDLLQSLLDFTG